MTARSPIAVPGVGALITEARERAGISQRELAKRMRASQPSVACWERERRAISLLDLLAVAEVLGIHVVELLPVPPPMPPPPRVVFAIKGPLICEKCGAGGTSPVIVRRQVESTPPA